MRMMGRSRCPPYPGVMLDLQSQDERRLGVALGHVALME